MINNVFIDLFIIKKVIVFKISPNFELFRLLHLGTFEAEGLTLLKKKFDSLILVNHKDFGVPWRKLKEPTSSSCSATILDFFSYKNKFSNTLYSQYHHVLYSDSINVLFFLEKILKTTVVNMRFSS